MDLAGRNALVTGVSRRAGIGFAIARRLLEGGAGVFVQGWTPHDAAQTRLIAWLCSDDARWITGQAIDSEGGFRR